jgi:uncharacterized membrane protein YuzA (DUF378 family)
MNQTRSINASRNKTIRYIMIFLVLLGSITWGLIGVFNYNIVHNLLLGNTIAKKIAYFAIGLAGLYLAINPSIYKPEKEACIFPSHLLIHCQEATQGKKMNITTRYPNTIIVYWTQLNEILNNSGTAKTNEFGIATIVLTQPNEKNGTINLANIPKEIYYRAIQDNGTLTRIESTKI